MIKVLIVDDHPVVRAGISRVLTEAPGISVAGEAATAREGLEQSRLESWDVIVVDMGLPDADGLELLKQLKLDQPSRPVLILTMRLDGDLAVRALKAGAAGYVGKDSPPAVIIDAVRKAAAGRPAISDWLAEQLAMRVGKDGDQPLHTRLSDREFEVLLLLASGQRPTEIATRLALSVKTVSTYRTRVLAKLDLANNAELAVYAARHKLLDATQ
ncbi:MAG TPA: response regulator transcription factor [Vicinamibacterales bacterium]|nr:response regulator transcription factor [Vicinamibacterales bacterium]